MSREWTTKQALFCLIGSTSLTLCIGFLGLFFWKKQLQERLGPRYAITTIVQTGPKKEALKTSYLAALLDLSIDRPISLYALDLEEAKKKLLASPLIADATVKRCPPSTLYIDYEVRQPIARIADLPNMGIDREGFLFPLAPFFPPQKMTEIYLGLTTDISWKIESPYLDLAFEILHFLDASLWKEGIWIERIDVSNAFAPSLGQREVVLLTEEEVVQVHKGTELVFFFPKILRLSSKDFRQQLSNFFSLRKVMMEDYRKQLVGRETGGRFAPRIIDLRIPQLGFVEKGERSF